MIARFRNIEGEKSVYQLSGKYGGYLARGYVDNDNCEQRSIHTVSPRGCGVDGKAVLYRQWTQFSGGPDAHAVSLEEVAIVGNSPAAVLVREEKGIHQRRHARASREVEDPGVATQTTPEQKHELTVRTQGSLAWFRPFRRTGLPDRGALIRGEEAKLEAEAIVGGVKGDHCAVTRDAGAKEFMESVRLKKGLQNHSCPKQL